MYTQPEMASQAQQQQTEPEVQSKPIPAFLEAFRNDPKTTSLREVHNSMIHVAFIVKRGQILASGSNRVGSRSRGAGYSNMTIHAEMNCLKKLGDLSQLRGADMYVIRMDKNRSNPQAVPNFQTSKPCHHCETVLRKCMREFGLKNVYYTS